MTTAVLDVLRNVTTATITTMLLKKGIRRCWMDGPMPLVPGEDAVGTHRLVQRDQVGAGRSLVGNDMKAGLLQTTLDELPVSFIVVGDQHPQGVARVKTWPMGHRLMGHASRHG